MGYRLVLATMIAVLLTLGCGEAESGPRTNPADTTATYEAARAEIVGTRAAERPTSTPTPTPTVARVASTPTATGATSQPITTAPPEASLPAKTLDELRGFMPPPGSVAASLVLTDDREWAAMDLAVTHDNTNDHLDRLAAWGFRRAWVQQYHHPDGMSVANQPYALVVGAEEYDTAEAALESITFNRSQHRDCRCLDYEDIELDPIGDTWFALAGESLTEPGVYWTFIWVQLDNVAIQYRFLSKDAAFTAELEQLARTGIED